MNDAENYEGKYLTFYLKRELYGIPVSTILQIIAIPDITPIPNTPKFVKGVINLRGKIIPVIDLRLKFGIEQTEYNERTSIIVIKIDIDEKEIFIGVIVDTVAEVIDIDSKEIEERPEFGVKLNTDFILAMAKVNDRVVTLINIPKILSEKDLSKLTNKAKEEISSE
ncbi:MAG: chemotaxis protein CheW [Candidatus Cloacimonadota bacterium]|nr:chemotaxis protein CheW [Candidatus Cloacimonadota bacterium]